MAIYAISDLHLSFGENKPMDIFGVNWEKHTEKIKEDWLKKVKENDTVILPGDFSWAMYLKDTYEDFEFINLLPGKKILLKGNHDYWWTTISKIKKYLCENNFNDIDLLYNNSFLIENKIITGTRGWANKESMDNEKIINRENIRLQLSIEDGIKKFGKDKEIITFLHYPPYNEANVLTETMQKYNVTKCIFGHVHGQSIKDIYQGKKGKIEFKLISCDSLGFELFKVV